MSDEEWKKWNAAFVAFVQGKKTKRLAALLRSGNPVPLDAAYALAELIDPTIPWSQFNWRKPAAHQIRRYVGEKRLVGPFDATPERVLKAAMGKTGLALTMAKAATAPAVRLAPEPLSEKHRTRLARNGQIVARMCLALNRRTVAETAGEKAESARSTHEAAKGVAQERA